MYKNAALNLGLIGLGNHMYSRLYPLTVNLPIHLSAVCDKDEEKCKRFTEMFHTERVYTDLKRMLKEEKLDGVLCAGNASLHYEAAKECMRQGVSIFVEKTPCESYEQALELQEIQRKTGCFVMTGFNRRFATAYQMAKEIIGRPEFGGRYLYMAKYHSSHYPSDEYFLFNHVIHHLDLARYFMGEIREIHGEKLVLGVGKVGYHIRFVTEAGALGFIESSSLQNEDFPMERVEITGDGCNVVVDNVKSLEYNHSASNKRNALPVLTDGKDLQGWNYNHGHSSLYSHYGFERELEVYINSLINPEKPELNYNDTVLTMKLFEELKSHCTLIEPEMGGR